jgi:hypothetical protein
MLANRESFDGRRRLKVLSHVIDFNNIFAQILDARKLTIVCNHYIR